MKRLEGKGRKVRINGKKGKCIFVYVCFFIFIW